MGKEIKKMLDEEIKSEIDDISSLEVGTEKHSSAVDSLVKLYKLKIEEEKTTVEHLENEQNREHDKTIKDAELKESKKDRYVKLGIAAAELILPLIFYGMWMNKGFEFEKEGTYTSKTFTGLINRFRPTKK